LLDGRALRPIRPRQRVFDGVVVEKMHLWTLAAGGENSIVASQQERNNFPFARVERDIYRK
jgi:hypothetical protein